MLKNIPHVISPDLMKYLMEMGHSDYLVISDANFPATSNAKRLIRLDGVLSDEILDAILKYYPLDNFIESPVHLMNYRNTEPKPEVWKDYERIIKKNDTEKAFDKFDFLDRLDFYKKTKDAYLVIQTSDIRRYANIIIQKGVC